MLLFLLACDGSTVPTVEPAVPLEPIPEGSLIAAFAVPLDVSGTPWTSEPLAILERSATEVELELTEIWREDTFFFPDCPIVVRLHGTLTGPRTYDLVLDDVVEDPCSIHAYAPGDRFVLRFEPRDRAFRWLADALSLSTAYLVGAEDELEDELGPSSAWFAFWGPSEDVLWPLGHVFP